MGTVAQWIGLLSANGSDVLFHRSESLIPCPCQTPEGFRDPNWHFQNPGAPVCDENGMLPDPANTIHMMVKGFVQPIQSTRATRLSTEYIVEMFGEIQADDHLGLLPCVWGGVTLDFREWAQSGQDYLEYDGQRFLVVNANKIPDPDGGDPNHHWEVGLRLISDVELGTLSVPVLRVVR